MLSLFKEKFAGLLAWFEAREEKWSGSKLEKSQKTQTLVFVRFRGAEKRNGRHPNGTKGILVCYRSVLAQNEEKKRQKFELETKAPNHWQV